MNKRFLRICSLLLAFVMVFNILPLQSFAEETAEQNDSASLMQDTKTNSELYVVKEVVENRTEFSKEFIMSNGLHMAAVYDNAVHYQVDGQWHEIDNTLKLSNGRSGNVYINTAGGWQVLFPQNMTANNGVSIVKDGYTLNFRMSGELHEAPGGSEIMSSGEELAAAETSPIESGEHSLLTETTEPPQVAKTTPPAYAAEQTEPPQAAETTEATHPTEAPQEADGTEPMQETEAANNVSAGNIVISGDVEAAPSGEVDILAAIGGEKSLALSQPAAEAAAIVVPVDTVDLDAEKEYEETVVDKLYSRLEYANVYSNTDIIYELNSNMVKESIVLSQLDTSLYGYTYLLDVGEMVPVLTEEGRIELYGTDGHELIMVMPSPYLVDDAGEYSYDVDVNLYKTNGKYVLSYLLPQAWLADSERAWPVILDPAVMPSLDSANIHDITLSSGGHHNYTSEYLHCGYHSSNTRLKLSRILVKYANLPELTSADMVVSATMRMYMLENDYSSGKPDPIVEVHKVNGTWEPQSVTWSSNPGYNPTVEDYTLVDSMGQHFWDVTDIVREWYEGENTGMLFKLPDEAESEENLNIIFHSADNKNYLASRKPALTIIFRNNNGLESY